MQQVKQCRLNTVFLFIHCELCVRRLCVVFGVNVLCFVGMWCILWERVGFCGNVLCESVVCDVLMFCVNVLCVMCECVVCDV